MIVDSRENPGLLLTWALYELARHPAVADRAEEEADEVLAGGEVTLGALGRLTLAHDVVRETLRLYPPAYSTGRQAVRDCTIAGIRVRRGTVILVSQWVTHRAATWFERPDEFLPDRWATAGAEGLPPGAYQPFSMGPRRCPGEHLARTVGVLGLAVMLRSHLDLVEADPTEPTVRLSLRPSREVLLRVRPRT